MSEQPFHENLRMENFTVFKDLTLDFVPGVNAFVGENGTGKTHVLKAMYALQMLQVRSSRHVMDTLDLLFQTQNPTSLIRIGLPSGTPAHIKGYYDGREWVISIDREGLAGRVDYKTRIEKVRRPVFIPAIDMMGHTKGFLAASHEVVLDFDLTCTDIVALLGLESNIAICALLF